MDAYILLFYLLLHPFVSSSATTNYNDCQTSYCGQNINSVHFLFRLIDQQPEICGFPGFDLRCVFQNTILIELPNADNFAIRNINYRHQTMRIYDPLNCLPAKFSKLDLSNSPFSASYYRNFTLLACPVNANLFGFKPINCLSNSSFSILATDSNTFVTSMTSNETGCVVSERLRVPVNQPYDDGFTSQLDDDITLTWGAPDCVSCEANGNSCGYADNTTQTITCFSNNSARKGSTMFRIIALVMVIPAMIASLAIACLMCSRDQRNELIMISNWRNTITTVTPQDSIEPPTIVGLDQATIESYKKVVLGESKRLPGHDDATCPICLSEYNVNETVRCIPECRHCFHAECIDEWLKMNGTCPICRYTPSPVHIEL
ncbi:putative RING-H2 finger protein ATL21A [Rutidosis leptorrhynchoides]|uniref:putative RING-H2 finger protein ATL21A n=1 Tax=Rutidosis leptorrhynchoides TaxID=125765 RepID=UPI003A99FF59